MGNSKSYHFPFIWIQSNTMVKNLSIDHLHRREYVNPIDTIRIDRDAIVDNMVIHDLTLENHTEKTCAKLVNKGTLKTLHATGLSEEEIVNEGIIENLTLN